MVVAVLACGPLSGLTGQVESQVQEAQPTAAIQSSTAVATQASTGGDGGQGGGTVQWAASAVASTEYGSQTWSAMQAAGAPDTEGCGDIETAWASANSTGVDWLELTYAVPVVPARIEIYETYTPGAIVEVVVANSATGFEQSVYTAAPTMNDQCPHTLTITVSDVSQPVDRVTVHLDQTDHGWNEIDAVALISQ